MIIIDAKNEILKISVYGEMTLADFTEFENAVTDELKQYDHVNVLLDLNAMTKFSIDVALEELRFNKVHAHDYEKVAVITDSQWIAWVSWLAAAFIDAQVQQFDDALSAEAWLAA